MRYGQGQGDTQGGNYMSNDNILADTLRFATSALLSIVTCMVSLTDDTFIEWLIMLVFWYAIYHWAISKVMIGGGFSTSESGEEISAVTVNALMQKHYSRFRIYDSGIPFHKQYQLVGLSLDEFETTIAAGMWFCGREVFVAAFIRDGVVVRVTTNVGELYSCWPDEDICDWISACKTIDCDYVRIYHNHPCFDGNTGPSTADKDFHWKSTSILNPKGIRVDSFIIYWNECSEWSLMQYDENRYSSTVKQFDAVSNSVITFSSPKRHWHLIISDFITDLQKYKHT